MASTTTEWRKRNPEKAAAARAREVAHPEFRSRRRETERKNREKHPEQQRARQLKMTYGITLDEALALLERQHGVCALCLEPLRINKGTKRNSSFHVDHDHKTGIVRGLLCHSCNNGLGAFRDDVRRLRRAVAYLEEHMRDIEERH